MDWPPYSKRESPKPGQIAIEDAWGPNVINHLSHPSRFLQDPDFKNHYYARSFSSSGRLDTLQWFSLKVCQGIYDSLYIYLERTEQRAMSKAAKEGIRYVAPAIIRPKLEEFVCTLRAPRAWRLTENRKQPDGSWLRKFHWSHTHGTYDAWISLHVFSRDRKGELFLRYFIKLKLGEDLYTL